MAFPIMSRRHLLQGTAATALASTLPGRAAFAADTVIGFVYVGSRDDYGYNQAHAAGAAALKKMAGIKVVEEEKVPETDAVEKTMESMINLDGATLLFPTSYGYYSPHTLKLARKYPKVRFEHAGGLWTDKDPKNVGSYFGYIDEAQHVAGIVAGATTKTGKLGFVAAKPIPQLLRNVNSFILGARLANPKATLAGHLHGRLVDAGEGSGSHQQPDRCRRRRHHLPRRRTEDRDGERRAPRRDGVELSRQRRSACAAGPPDRRRMELGSDLSALRHHVHQGRDHSELLSRRLEGRRRQGRGLWPQGLRGGAQAGRRRQGQAHRRQLRHLQGPAQGQQGQRRDRRPASSAARPTRCSRR